MSNFKAGIKKDKGEENISTNGWMTTFSDLCTLLLTFFVLLFSMSSMDDQKLKISFQNFGGSSGILFFREYREISKPMETMIDGFHKTLGIKVSIGKERDIQEVDVDMNYLETLGGFLVIQPLIDGIKLAFGENLLFPPASAEIKEEAIPILHKIAKFLSISGYQAYIDGHSDNTPIHSDKYSSNEELSIARAFSVRDCLLRLENILPEFVALTGYGALKPIASNGSKEGRNKNRRVEIILKNQKYF